jgi:hypothetical protein
MDKIKFESSAPIEMNLIRPVQAFAQGESVVLLLPVSVAGDPQQEREVRLVMNIGLAELIPPQVRSARLNAIAFRNAQRTSDPGQQSKVVDAAKFVGVTLLALLARRKK